MDLMSRAPIGENHSLSISKIKDETITPFQPYWNQETLSDLDNPVLVKLS